MSKNKEEAINLARELKEDGKIAITRSEVEERLKKTTSIEKIRIEYIQQGFQYEDWSYLDMSQSEGDAVFISKTGVQKHLQD